VIGDRRRLLDLLLVLNIVRPESYLESTHEAYLETYLEFGVVFVFLLGGRIIIGLNYVVSKFT